MTDPSPTTDAAPPERGCKGLVVLAGAIKWWWLSECISCGTVEERKPHSLCSFCGRTLYREFWGSGPHKEYVAWRDKVRKTLIDAGYLTYAPHEAFKGTWTEKGQVVNDAAIATADWVVVLSPPGILTDGTDDEVAYAQKVGTPVYYFPPGTSGSLEDLLQ